MKLAQDLTAEVQPARLHVPRTNGGSNDMERTGIDGHGDARASGSAGLSRLLAQKASFEQFGHVRADSIGSEFGALVQLPTAERSFATKNSQNSALMERQDRLFITDHDRK